MTKIAQWFEDYYAFGVVGLVVVLVVVYFIWVHRLFASVEHYAQHGHETDPYIEQVRQERATAGESIAVIVTVNTIDGKQKRFYYHENSETRFRITDDDTLYLDF